MSARNLESDCDRVAIMVMTLCSTRLTLALEGSWSDGVEGDTPAAVVSSKVTGHVVNAGLGGRVRVGLLTVYSDRGWYRKTGNGFSWSREATAATPRHTQSRPDRRHQARKMTTTHAGTLIPSTLPMLMTRAGSSNAVSLPCCLTTAASRRGMSFWVRVKTRWTLRSMTFAKAWSGNSARVSPHVAPALLTRTWSSVRYGRIRVRHGVRDRVS